MTDDPQPTPAPKPKRDPATKRKTGTHPQRAPRKPRHRLVGEGLTLTPEITDKIVNALRVGAPMNTAAAYAGVGSSTFRLWLTQGRKGVAPYVPFVEAIDLAVADGKMRDLVRIDEAANTDWRAGAWKLERGFPLEFGQRTQSDVTVSARPFVDVAKLTLDEQTLLLELLRKGTPDAADVPKDGRGALELMPGEAAA